MKLSTKDFEVLYKKHYRTVRSVVKGFRFGDGVADDLIQDSFIAAWKNIESLVEEKAFGGWISVIARNACLQELRKQKKTVSISGTDFVDSDSDDPSQAEGGVVLIANDDMKSAEWEHSVEICRQVIQAYDDEPRSTIARRFYLDQHTIKEICGELGLNQNTVLSHLRRFRQVVAVSIKQLIEEAGIDGFVRSN